MTEREQFEAWTAANYRLGARQNPWDIAWEAWQASRRAGLTEAANITAPLAHVHPMVGGIHKSLIDLRDKEGA